MPLEYDPMLSKLIVHAPDRAGAIARMRCALDEYFVGGIKTNLSLFRRILEHPDFVAARIDTGFLDRLLAANTATNASNGLSQIAAVAAALFAVNSTGTNGRNGGTGNGEKDSSSAWKRTARTEGLREP